MMATANFNLENSIFFCIDLVYHIPLLYQLSRLIVELLTFWNTLLYIDGNITIKLSLI